MTEEVCNSSNQVFFRGEYLPTDNMLNCEWIGFIAEIEPSKEACNKVVELSKKYNSSCVLNDNRNQTGPWPKIDDWLENHWMPSLAAAGVKFIAHIHSPNVFTNFSAQKHFKDTKHGIEFKHFQDEEEAKNWLKEMAKEIGM
ncbi:hypothetical protein V6R21_09575 [Limibacter armeniacum]|uniref:hypothetical protein n=1 Tax=Limibacter armeniacum TaxID=466084 RepID=UPI002FE599D7